MLLEEKKVSVRSSGMVDTVDFTAKLDGLMFDNLINGIYSNKIGAGIREYSTNARDGHARRGNLDTPFEVGLPTRSNPIFEVRDFGSSLTHKEVFEIFTVLGESTKRTTNDETGCLGLGSKSAFAYTNTFNVTCWLDGEERNYVCYIGEEGKPKTSLLSTVKSNKTQGMRVSYSVLIDDVMGFNEEASRQLRGFDPQPTITRKGESYRELSEDRLMMKGDGWKIYKTEESGYYGYNKGKPMAIQGSVSYPIAVNNSALSNEIQKEDYDTRESIKRLLSATDTLINFNIGEISMTTSREELQYNEMTCRSIVRKAREVVNKVKKDLDANYASCTTMKQARILYAKTVKGDRESIDYILNITDREWKGTKIKAHMTMGHNKAGLIGEITKEGSYYNGNDNTLNPFAIVGELRVEDGRHYANPFGTVKASFQFRDITNSNASTKLSVSCDKASEEIVLVDIVTETKDLKTNAYLREFWHTNMAGKNRFIWLKVQSRADAKTFLDQIFHEDPTNVVYLHELTPMDMPKRTNATTGQVIKQNDYERTIRYIVGSRYAVPSEQNMYDKIDFLTDPIVMPVVYFSKGEWYWTKKDMDAEENSTNYQTLCADIQSWSGNKFKVYVVNNNQKNFVRDNPQFATDLKEALIVQWKAANPDWEKQLSNRELSDSEKREQEARVNFGKLKSKLDLRPKAITPEMLKSDQVSKFGSMQSLTKPRDCDEWMKNDIATAKIKYADYVLKTPFSDILNSDPVLDYLLNEYTRYYNVSDDITNAITHHIKTQHT